MSGGSRLRRTRLCRTKSGINFRFDAPRRQRGETRLGFTGLDLAAEFVPPFPDVRFRRRHDRKLNASVDHGSPLYHVDGKTASLGFAINPGEYGAGPIVGCKAATSLWDLGSDVRDRLSWCIRASAAANHAEIASKSIANQEGAAWRCGPDQPSLRFRTMNGFIENVVNRYPDEVRFPADHSSECPRNLRLDACRGLALWFIFLDHIPDNAFSWLTLRNYGFLGCRGSVRVHLGLHLRASLWRSAAR
jgi:OpgC protein